MTIHRPHTTVILAMSADGKIADFKRSAARFGSSADQAHLEQQVAQSDGVLFGAGTLRAYGTTLKVSQAELLQARSQLGKSPQPVQIVCSQSGQLDFQARFFQQAVPRWLLTTEAGAKHWHDQPGFERVLVAEAIASAEHSTINWLDALKQLADLGLKRLAILGGGHLVASLLAQDCIDEVWLTVCPLLIGGATAPTPVEGSGFLANAAPRLQLLSTQVVEQEVFLHYRLQHEKD